MRFGIVRPVSVLAAAGWLMGTTCTEEIGPAGLIPAGDYRIMLTTPMTNLVIPAPPPLSPGCGTLADARLVIADDGSVLHTRTITQMRNGELVSGQQEFHPELRSYTKTDRIELRYRGWVEIIRVQAEPTPDFPDFTILYVDQLFLGDGPCLPRRLILRYTNERVPAPSVATLSHTP